MGKTKEKGMCKACLQAELDIEALEVELQEAREAAQWCNEHRGDWDGPAISPEERWPSVFQGGE